MKCIDRCGTNGFWNAHKCNVAELARMKLRVSMSEVELPKIRCPLNEESDYKLVYENHGVHIERR